MIYLPGSCERCLNIALISSDDCIGGKALCGACGGLATVIPGRAYAEADAPLFNELSRIIAESGINGLEADHVATALEEALLSHGEQEALSVLTFWVPVVQPLRPTLAADPATMRQAISMASSVLYGRARVRQSTIVTAGEHAESESTPLKSKARQR